VQNARADLQRNAGGSDRRTTDDGGHIVGNRFNPPAEEFNLFAQDANFNRGSYRVLEGKWADALAEGQAVKVEWRFYYAEGSVRPTGLDVTYRIGAEPAVTKQFKNASRGGG
jgi:allophanate hydrolase subunit 2